MYHPAPGDKPKYRSGMSNEEYRAYEIGVQDWEHRTLLYGLQQGGLERAIAREEKRQDTMRQYSLDRVKCTRNLIAQTKCFW